MNNPDLHDETFGALKWNDERDCYESHVLFASETLVSVSLHEADEAPGIIPEMARICRAIRDNQAVIERSIADKLLEMYNSGWRDEDDDAEPISAETFIARIGIEGISFYEDATAEIYYDDGNLFAGHAIVAGINAAGKLTGANIAG